MPDEGRSDKVQRVVPLEYRQRFQEALRSTTLEALSDPAAFQRAVSDNWVYDVRSKVRRAGTQYLAGQTASSDQRFTARDVQDIQKCGMQHSQAFKVGIPRPAFSLNNADDVTKDAETFITRRYPEYERSVQQHVTGSIARETGRREILLAALDNWTIRRPDVVSLESWSDTLACMVRKLDLCQRQDGAESSTMKTSFVGRMSPETQSSHAADDGPDKYDGGAMGAMGEMAVNAPTSLIFTAHTTGIGEDGKEVDRQTTISVPIIYHS